MAGGCLVDDFNGDGRLDVFMPTTDPERGAALFVNRGDGTFEDVSEQAGLADQVGVAERHPCRLRQRRRPRHPDAPRRLGVAAADVALAQPRRRHLRGRHRRRRPERADRHARRPAGPTTTTTASSTSTSPANSTRSAPTRGIAAGSTTITATARSKMSPPRPACQRTFRQGGRLGRLRRRWPARPLRLEPEPSPTGSITTRATARSSTSPPRSV